MFLDQNPQSVEVSIGLISPSYLSGFYINSCESSANIPVSWYSWAQSSM